MLTNGDTSFLWRRSAKAAAQTSNVLLTRSAVATLLPFKVHATATAMDIQSLALNLLHLVHALAQANQYMRHCR